MIILCVILIPLIYTILKLILNFIICKFGKFSYNGLSVAGFKYDPYEDIFYSTKGAWQKNFGYGHIYDVTAPIFRMIIDTEPVHFSYNNKNWLITFWKGQYGITTGAEIGIYCTKEKKVTKNTIYLQVEDSEMLDNTFIFNYKKPRTRKVWTRSLIGDFIIQSLNKRNVRLYNKYLSDAIEDNTQQTDKKVIMVKNLVPNILKSYEDEDVKNKNNENQKVKKIEKMINKNNVILLNDDIYSNLRDEYE